MKFPITPVDPFVGRQSLRFRARPFAAGLFVLGIVMTIAVSPTVAGPFDKSLATHDVSPSERDRYCAPLATAVSLQTSAATGGFVRSYDPGDDEASLPEGLASTAFVYDNALAVIALVACGDIGNATLIGKALSDAVRKDRTFLDGRVRNAYRAGPVGREAALLPGWWDKKRNLWMEDAAQDGTSTGNVAWAALALLTLHQATKQEAFLADARQLMDWILSNASSADGFTGGLHGFDPQQIKLTWISTEHNVDVYAVARWLFDLTHERKYADAMSQSRRFLERAFDTDHFVLGTKPDGQMADSSILALDVQLWPWMAVPDAPVAWRSALGFAEKNLAVKDGFDFSGDRDGLWVEGTAQAALGYLIVSDRARSNQLLETLEANRTKSGFLNATREARVSTQLSIDPTKSDADFFYYRRPHLGATAWDTLAGMAWNPFTGRRVE